MTGRDRVQQLRASIHEMVVEFVPTTDVRRVMADVDELIEMIRTDQRGRISSGDGREFS